MSDEIHMTAFHRAAATVVWEQITRELSLFCHEESEFEQCLDTSFNEQIDFVQLFNYNIIARMIENIQIYPGMTVTSVWDYIDRVDPFTQLANHAAQRQGLRNYLIHLYRMEEEIIEAA